MKMKGKIEMETFQTKDLAEASLLYASGKKFLQLKHDGIGCWFIFSDKTTCQELVDSYWRKEAVINAKEYDDAQRNLKSLLFNRE